MWAYRNLLNFFGILLLLGSGMAFASDDNPWSMDESADSQNSYFDLDSGRTSGPIVKERRLDKSSNGRLAPQGRRSKETTHEKTPFLGGRNGVSGRTGKQHRDKIFGYSGEPQKTYQRDSEPTDHSKFGSFPPRSGMVDKKNKSGTSGRVKAGVQFGGKSYGSFPPNESKSGELQRQKLLKARRKYQRLMQQQSSGFTNVLPPPIPEPVPEGAFPYSYSGYGRPPGYGGDFGSGPGLSRGFGGPGYGPSLVNPGMPGLTLPGFMW